MEYQGFTLQTTRQVMTHHTPAHPARQHWLSVGGSNYSDKDHFSDMDTTRCSLSFAHSKYNHACIHIYLYNCISDLARSLMTSYR
jgi:hypothetical protein